MRRTSLLQMTLLAHAVGHFPQPADLAIDLAFARQPDVATECGPA
jgi:hypothetical protein